MRRVPVSTDLVTRLSTTTPGQPSSQQEVLLELRRVILAGNASPGTPIPLDEVARFFDCSLIPVRESLLIFRDVDAGYRREMHAFIDAAEEGQRKPITRRFFGFGPTGLSAIDDES